MSGTMFTKAILPEHSNDFEKVLEVTRDVQRIISGIVGEGVDSEEFSREVKIRMQPMPDGGLAIMGWHPKDPVQGIPEITYNTTFEVVPNNEVAHVPEPEVATNPFQPS
jgi:hypothetical protein